MFFIKIFYCEQQVNREVTRIHISGYRWLCVRSWLASNPTNKEITRSSGGVIEPYQEFFFFTKIMIFLGVSSIFPRLWWWNIGGRPEVTNSYSFTSAYVCLHSTPSWVVTVSLIWGRRRCRTVVKSWRSLTPESRIHQYPMMGPIPQRSDLSHPHPLDAVTRQPWGWSHRCRNGTLCTPRTYGDPIWLLLYAAIASSNLPKLQTPMVSRTHVCLLLRWRLDQHHKYNDCQSRVPKTPIWNPPNKIKTDVTQETVLDCVRIRLILVRPYFHVTTVLHARCLPEVDAQVPMIKFS